MLGIFLDTETNGLDPQKHRVLEIAFKLIDLYTGEEKESYDTLVKVSEKQWEQSDPESLDVCQISFSQTNTGNELSHIQKSVREIFLRYNLLRGKAVFICQNPSFDRVFFAQIMPIIDQETLKIPYHWLDLASMFWGKTMEKSKTQLTPFPWEIGFSKDKIAHFFSIEKEQRPHRAINGVNHLIACYKAVCGFPNQPHTCL